MNLTRRQILAAIGAASATTSAPLRAQTGRVRRLLVGFPPGGGMDSAGRIVAARLSEALGEQIIVENRPGAGGTLALAAAAHAAPDGFTLVISAGSPAVSALLAPESDFDPAADLIPVAMVGTFTNLLVVPNGSPFGRVEDLIAAAKARPGKITWASPGIGSQPYLAGALFVRMAGLQITHVPYRGVAAGAMTDLIAGRVDVMFNTSGSLLGPVRAQQVRALAVTSPRPFPLAPELPTIAASGVPGYDGDSWYGIYLPAHTPAGTVSRLTADCIATFARPEVKRQFEPLGVIATGAGPDELAARNAADFTKWKPVIAAAGLSHG